MKRYCYKTAVVLLAGVLSIGGAKIVYAEVGYVDWDGKNAIWEDDTENVKYQVTLYRNSSQVTSKETSDTFYNFSSYINQEGRYRFRVREIDGSTKGSWSEYSQYLRVTLDGSGTSYSVSTDEPQVSTKAVAIIPSSSGTAANWAIGNTTYTNNVAEGWQQDATGWWYRNTDGSYPKSEWMNTGAKWYYFNEHGYMMTGWISRGGKYFYCRPDGSMVTGWNMIDGAWYYFDEWNGAMYVNTTTPDGGVVGEDGKQK